MEDDGVRQQDEVAMVLGLSDQKHETEERVWGHKLETELPWLGFLYTVSNRYREWFVEVVEWCG